jgi:Zn-finger protein
MKKQAACQPSQAFTQNRACRYFPCHPGADPDTFNCLFCYCPLYFLENCGGKFEMLSGVKDCTRCLRPHNPGGYEDIVARLKRELGERRKKYLEEQEKGEG